VSNTAAGNVTPPQLAGGSWSSSHSVAWTDLWRCSPAARGGNRDVQAAIWARATSDVKRGTPMPNAMLGRYSLNLLDLVSAE